MIPEIHFRFDWAAGGMLLAVLLFFWLVGRRGRDKFLLLRFAVYAFLLWMAAEPTLSWAPRKSDKPSLAVLLDVSRSMSVRDPEERLALAKRILKNWRDDLEDHFDLSYFQFARESSPLDWPALSRSRPEGGATDIVRAVRQAALEKKQAPGAVLLLSDGANTAAEPEEEEIPLPVYAVGIGNAEALSDVALKDFRGSDFAFKGRPVELSVTLENFGYLGRTLPVVLSEKRGEGFRSVAVQEVRLEKAQGRTEVSFRFVPDSPGAKEYRLAVPPQKNEVSTDNNLIDFRLEVGREKIRVLYLCGQPGPEYAYLRQMLKSDPSIELISFVILRNPENVVPVPEEQLSLIPFPAHDIFVTTLQEFDLLIFENFSYSRFNIQRSHLDNIRRFVEEKGGGFLMIGGDNSFGLGGYKETGLEAILPVAMNPASETVSPDPVALRVLEPQHPLFDTGESAEKVQKFWRGLPKLNGYHHLAGAKEGAILFATVEGSGAPAIVGWQRGRGRVLALATLSTWQWALGLSERGLLQSSYSQFWRQAVRWLISSGEEKPLRIVLRESRPRAGRKNLVKVILQPDRFKNKSSLEVSLSVRGPSGGTEILPLASGGRFDYRADWLPQSEGDYTFSAVVRDGQKKVEESRNAEVSGVDLELENPYPDFLYLKELAEKSGGLFFKGEDFNPARIRGRAPAPVSPAGKTQVPLWHNHWLFGLLLLLLFMEWGWRRWSGGI